MQHSGRLFFLAAGAAARRYYSAPAARPAADFLPNFLITNCGISAGEAFKASSRIPSAVNSPGKLAAAVAFLRGIGLRSGDLSKLVLWSPSTLLADVDSTLRPKVDALRAFGFSDADVIQLVAASPAVLRRNEVIPKLELLRRYLPDTADMLKAVRRDPFLLNCNLIATLAPNFALLEARRVSPARIGKMLVSMPRLLSRRAEQFAELVGRAERLGFAPGGAMYLWAVLALAKVSEELLAAKVDTMKSFGWSEEDFYAAFRRQPKFIYRSAAALRRTMRFLVEEVGFSPECVAERPVMLLHSVEKRLAPRHRVFVLLKKEGLVGEEKLSYTRWFQRPDAWFVESFVTPFMAKVPTLAEVAQPIPLPHPL